jgi:heat shock protein HslJ
MSRAAVCLLPLLLAACALSTPTGPPEGAPDTDPLAQVERWILQGASDAGGARIDAVFPHGRPVHALRFGDGRLGIEGGCNHIGGDYRIDDRGRLVVGAIASTMMACADSARMEADAAVVALVQGTSDWRIAESWPEELFLEHAGGRRSVWVADRAGE